MGVVVDLSAGESPVAAYLSDAIDSESRRIGMRSFKRSSCFASSKVAARPSSRLLTAEME